MVRILRDISRLRRLFMPAIATVLPASIACAQDNYEIQVYGSSTVEPAVTMVELHSNFTFTGSRAPVNGVLPTESALHETLEITHGWTEWLEVGAYLFTSVPDGRGWQVVGSHLRPRVAAPEEWHWPVGVSLSLEAGYQRPAFSEDTWSVEMRPIIDKQWGRWYVSLNPVLDHSLKGEGAADGFGFSPNAKISCSVSDAVALGLEYYGAFGPVDNPDRFRDQEHQIVPAVDLNVSPEWEINFGVCIGLTPATDHMIAKMILGRRIGGEERSGG